MAGLFKELVKAPLLHVKRLCSDPIYRKYYWLRSKYDKFPALKQVKVNFDGLSLIVPDMPSFLAVINEIFLDNVYQFEADSKRPVVIDLGANIGISAIYFKRLYPKAQLSVYEADKNIFEVLSKNLNNNGIVDVEAYNLAVWDSNCEILFKPDNADGGCVSTDDSGVLVKAIDISDILNKFGKIDFLKMDIEGAENNLLDKLSDNLHKIDSLFIEYHSFKDSPQKLGELLKILEAGEFRYNIGNPHPGGMALSDFSQTGNFDIRINIWAKKIL
jgi:FkbM family methyltransferase